MTKEEKILIDLRWKKEKQNSFDTKGQWVKEYSLFPVMYTRIQAFTQLCIGFFLYDEFLNELHLAYLSDQRFFELVEDVTFSDSNSVRSTEVLFGYCDKKIKEKTFKVKDLYMDDSFFKHRPADIIYVPHKGNKMQNTNSSHYKFYIFDPDLQDPDKHFFYSVIRELDHATMMELALDDIVCKKYKLNKDANT